LTTFSLIRQCFVIFELSVVKYFAVSPVFHNLSGHPGKRQKEEDENQQHVASCCRCVAGGKGQRNPCKMGFVAVLPIFRTSIYQYDLSGDF
jgi:hypothetical protein